MLDDVCFCIVLAVVANYEAQRPAVHAQIVSAEMKLWSRVLRPVDDVVLTAASGTRIW